MTGIPRAPLWLGLAGLIPFIWGALTGLVDPLANWGAATFGGRFVGPYIQLFYGTVILSFMSGVLWGFATKTSGAKATAGYILAVIPASCAALVAKAAHASDRRRAGVSGRGRLSVAAKLAGGA